MPSVETQIIPTNEVVPVSSLIPNPANPRSIKTEDLERLKRQLSKLKAYKPIVVDTRTGMVCDGHMRLEALKQLGVHQVWVAYIETKDDAEALEYMLSSNDAAGRYDDQLLAELITNTPNIELTDYKVDLGESIDLSKVLERFGPKEPDEEDIAGEGEAKPFKRVTFTFAAEQWADIDKAIRICDRANLFDVYGTDNKDANGNAISAIVKDWLEEQNGK